jgi:hypothetical protein
MCTCEFGNPDHQLIIRQGKLHPVCYSRKLWLCFILYSQQRSPPPNLWAILATATGTTRQKLHFFPYQPLISPSDPVFHDINDLHKSSVTISNIPSIAAGYFNSWLWKPWEAMAHICPYKWMYTMYSMAIFQFAVRTTRRYQPHMQTTAHGPLTWSTEDFGPS